MPTSQAVLSPRCEFEVILDDFKAQLTSKELDEFKFSSLESLRATIKRIQKEQEAKRRMRNMKRLEPFLRTMDQYGSVVEVFVNTSETLAFVWGPMKWLLMVASNYSEAMDSLLDAYQTIWEELPLLGTFKDLYSHRPYMKTVLSWIYQDILDFHREAMAYFRQKAWKQLFQAVWRGFKTKIDLIKGRMQRNSNLIKTEASLAEFEEVRRIHKAATDEFANQRQAEFDRRRIYVTQWIGAPNINATQEENHEARICADAGSWVMASSFFKKWIDPIYCENPLLWMTGKPGAGKSVLVSRIVDEVCQLRKAVPDPSKPDTSVAFFYCKHQNADQDGFLAIAKGLLSQLLAQNPQLLQYFYEKASLSGEASLRVKSLARELLGVALSCPKRTYIILDGLDECDRKERKDITSFMRNAVESLPLTDMAAIRCLFVCQDDGPARKDLKDIPSINIRPSDIKNDIQNFCGIWRSKIEQKLGPLQNTEYNLVKIVTAKAQGMFLFAKLVMENLYEQTTKENLLAELRNFQSGLDEVYNRIILRILDRRTSARQADARKLLEWLTCSKRPMKWYEIQAALCVDLDDMENELWDLTAGDAARAPKSFVDLWSSIIGTRRYLIRTNKVVPRNTHFQITGLTLGYLSLPQNDCESGEDQMKQATLDGFFGYLQYAAVCWVLHVQEALFASLESEQLVTLREGLEVFLEGHYREPEIRLGVPKTISDELHQMRPSEVYDSLSQAVVWSRKQLMTHGQASLDDGVLDLMALVSRFRDVLESLSNSQLSNDTRSALQLHYGTRWYKCRYLGCFYFHHGFKTKAQRDQHSNRHEKPFICIITECDFSSLGFESKDALSNHLLEAHEIDLDGDLSFPPPPRKIQKIEAGSRKYQCQECLKIFTRGHNLKAHLRSHTNEKPYSCSICGMKFGRQYDRNRHESLHTGEKTHKCFGTLNSGAVWGCSLAFGRADKLADHFKSKTGRQCIEPLLAEERREAQETNSQVAIEAAIASRVGIDQSLLDSLLFQAHAHNSYQHQPSQPSLPGNFFK